NYGFGWGTGGSSKRGNDDTYMGPAPFSEPETKSIRDFVEKTTNATVLLSFHTFSELILYPWGGKYDPVADAKDHSVFETMAKQMATWNGYTPQQASDLYIASGDTVDWAYGEHKIFGFTFELDPSSIWDGGFYPGQKVIPGVFAKNWQACLYMIGLADNPYRAIETPAAAYGLSSPLLR
ncbi:MAG: M14 family zinc carboxypeptidase, partial [Bdellovibrionota bacterium]